MPTSVFSSLPTPGDSGYSWRLEIIDLSIYETNLYLSHSSPTSLNENHEAGLPPLERRDVKFMPRLTGLEDVGASVS